MFYFCTISLNVTYFNKLSLPALKSSAEKKKEGHEGMVISMAKIKSYLWKPLSTLAGPEYTQSTDLTAQHLRKKGLMLRDGG